MSERPLVSTDEASLEIALHQLAAAIDWPTASPLAGPDLATLVRVRLIEREGHRRSGSIRSWRPTTGRRAVVLALAALLVLAAVAGAVGLGLPGLRIILAEPSDPPPSVGPSRSPGRSPATSPSPSEVVSVPGSGLRLGRVTTLEEAEAATGLRIRLPSDPLLGPPDAVFVDRERASQVALVWADRADLPASLQPGVGLILMAFDGTVDPSFIQKVIGGGSRVSRLSVGADPGFWIEGDPHLFFYSTEGDLNVNDSRRWVGDALLWSDGRTTYRIESALGREATLAIAESIR